MKQQENDPQALELRASCRESCNETIEICKMTRCGSRVSVRALGAAATKLSSDAKARAGRTGVRPRYY